MLYLQLGLSYAAIPAIHRVNLIAESAMSSVPSHYFMRGVNNPIDLDSQMLFISRFVRADSIKNYTE